MTSGQLRAYPDSEAKKVKEGLDFDGLDELIEKKLEMKMNNKDGKSRMQGLFTVLHSNLSEQGVRWIIKEKQKQAVTHVLYVLCLQFLNEKWESYLSLSHHALQKDFEKCLKHAINLFKAFQLLDSSLKIKTKMNDDGLSVNPQNKNPQIDRDKGG